MSDLMDSPKILDSGACPCEGDLSWGHWLGVGHLLSLLVFLSGAFQAYWDCQILSIRWLEAVVSRQGVDFRLYRPF